MFEVSKVVRSAPAVDRPKRDKYGEVAAIFEMVDPVLPGRLQL
jgi:hypothetical protein